MEAEARDGDPGAVPATLGSRGLAAGWEMALRSSNRQRNVGSRPAWGGANRPRPRNRLRAGARDPRAEPSGDTGSSCGVDHSAVMVQQATRRNAAAVRAGRVEFRLGSAEQLPAFTEPFDKVLVVNNLGMWHEPDERLKALYRLMRPGGRIAIVSQPRCPGATAETTVRLRARPYSGLQESPVGHAGAHAPRYLRARGGPVKTAVPVPSTPRWLESEFPWQAPCLKTTAARMHQEVANRGMARPPLVYGAAMVTGVFIECGWPLPFLPRLLAALLGSVLVVVAVVVFAYAIRQFQTGTPVPGNKPTTVLVRTGPYRQPEPDLCGVLLFQLGIASWVNSGVDRHPHRGSGPHGRRRDPKRGAVLRKRGSVPTTWITNVPRRWL